MNTNWSMLYSLHDRIFGRMMSAKIAELGPCKILFPIKAMIKRAKIELTFLELWKLTWVYSNLGNIYSRKSTEF